MAFFDEWKEKWESWSLAVKGAVIGGVLLLLVGIGSFVSKKEEAVEETEAVVTTVLAEKTEESTTLEAVIFVDIKGAVKKPGVYQMKVGDRVKDAIDAAGGLTAEADSQKVNLAQQSPSGLLLFAPSSLSGYPPPPSILLRHRARLSPGHQPSFDRLPAFSLLL